MTISLHFQSPTAPQSTLLSELLSATNGATAGGGIFAWTNIHGLNAVMGNPTFSTFLKNHSFDMIVGTDTITDERAIDALQGHAQEFPRLTVRAFVHQAAPLFHPKMAWFRNADGLRLIVGSGNFTRGGLQANWEIFTSAQVVGSDAASVLGEISDWQSAHGQFLLPLADHRVTEAVSGNVGNERSLRQRSVAASAVPGSDTIGTARGSVCLVAEIPKNRKLETGESAFSQANFPRDIFQSFFESQGAAEEILLYHVDERGLLDAVESTNGKYKSVSRNYYFELAAAVGLPHPGKKPPIAVFLKLDSGAFLYLFRLPGQAGYAELDQLLADGWVPKANQLRRRITDRQRMATYWPTCPVLAAHEPGS